MSKLSSCDYLTKVWLNNFEEFDTELSRAKNDGF